MLVVYCFFSCSSTTIIDMYSIVCEYILKTSLVFCTIRVVVEYSQTVSLYIVFRYVLSSRHVGSIAIKIAIMSTSSVMIIAHPCRSAWFHFTIGDKKCKTLITVLPYEEIQNKIVEDPTELLRGPHLPTTLPFGGCLCALASRVAS